MTMQQRVEKLILENADFFGGATPCESSQLGEKVVVLAAKDDQTVMFQLELKDSEIVKESIMELVPTKPKKRRNIKVL